MSKTYYVQNNVGRSKYVVNYCTGSNKHEDGSDFFDVRIFKNKKLLNQFIKTLIAQGYRHF